VIYHLENKHAVVEVKEFICKQREELSFQPAFIDTLFANELNFQRHLEWDVGIVHLVECVFDKVVAIDLEGQVG
jgi:hypothetical protein